MSFDLHKKCEKLEAEIKHQQKLMQWQKDMIEIQKKHIKLLEKNSKNSFNHLKIVK